MARKRSQDDNDSDDDDDDDTRRNETVEGGETKNDVSKKRRWMARLMRKSSANESDEEKKDDGNDTKSKKEKDKDKEGDAQSTTQQSTLTKTTQATKNTRTISNCETDYHEAIRDHDWDDLEGLLKEYDPEIYKKPKKAVIKSAAGKKKLKFVKYLPDLSKYKKEKEEAEIPISPLMALDKDGRTPLHLACVEPTPRKLILSLMNCARDAAAVLDKDGNLPIHLAVRLRRPLSIIEKLIRGYYIGSWTVDRNNRTPLILAIEETLKKMQEEKIQPTKTYWGFPISADDLTWQEQQKQLWQGPNFLVENRAARRKRLLTIENKQILVALSQSAPPNVIRNFMLTGKKALIQEEVTGKVLFLLINRQYPIHLFQSLFQFISVDYAKEEKDSTGCGIVSSQFRIGCTKHKDQYGREKDSFAVIMQNLAHDEKNLVEDSISAPQIMEWWEKLRFLINLWSTHSKQEGLADHNIFLENQFIIYKVLMNSDTPPALIQLIANLYPQSIKTKCADALPIHFACRHWQFRDYPPRRGEKKLNIGQACSALLEKDPTTTRKRYHRRLPLHHAISVSKTWDFIKPLVTLDLESLRVRDPSTMLYPFQMAALKIQETFDIEAITRRAFTSKIWEDMTDDEQDRQMRKTLFHYDLRRLDLVYKLLRHLPNAISRKLSPKKSFPKSSSKVQTQQIIQHVNISAATEMKYARSIFGLGNVAGHFIGWCYKNTNGAWKTHRTNFAVVKEAIIDGFVPISMHVWWQKLKIWLWLDCPRRDDIPRRDDYLLHCALCNSNVSPWIVELILECFPRSAHLPLPDSNGCYPLHIACSTDAYTPLPFEFQNKRNVIEMVAKVFHDAILLKYKDRLPLHYALSVSKKWEEIKYIAEIEPVSLAVPDPKSDVFPFQQVALHKPYSKAEMQRFTAIAEKTFVNSTGRNMNPNEKVKQLKQILEKHENETTGCIFELLRHNPMLVHVGGMDWKNRSQQTENETQDKLSIQQYLNMLNTEEYCLAFLG